MCSHAALKRNHVTTPDLIQDFVHFFRHFASEQQIEPRDVEKMFAVRRDKASDTGTRYTLDDESSG